MNGKGSKQRPTDQKKYADNWDRIFGKKQCKKCGGEMIDCMKCKECGWSVT